MNTKKKLGWLKILEKHKTQKESWWFLTPVFDEGAQHWWRDCLVSLWSQKSCINGFQFGNWDGVSTPDQRERHAKAAGQKGAASQKIHILDSTNWLVQNLNTQQFLDREGDWLPLSCCQSTYIGIWSNITSLFLSLFIAMAQSRITFRSITLFSRCRLFRRLFSRSMTPKERAWYPKMLNTAVWESKSMLQRLGIVCQRG